MLKEEFKQSGWEDFAKRYGSTYGWFEASPEKRILVLLSHVNENGLSFQDADGIQYKAAPDQGNEFVFIPVERRLCNVDNDVWYTYRVPARQWKRGICSSNTVVMSLTANKKLGVNFMTVANILKDQRGNMRRFIESYEGPVALNDCFAIIKNKVMLFDVKIGTYKDKTITLENDTFSQEVKDALRRSAITNINVVATKVAT